MQQLKKDGSSDTNQTALQTLMNWRAAERHEGLGLMMFHTSAFHHAHLEAADE